MRETYITPNVIKGNLLQKITGMEKTIGGTEDVRILVDIFYERVLREWGAGKLFVQFTGINFCFFLPVFLKYATNEIISIPATVI